MEPKDSDVVMEASELTGFEQMLKEPGPQGGQQSNLKGFGFKAADAASEAAPSTPGTTRLPAPGSPFTGTASEAPSLSMSEAASAGPETEGLKTVKLLMGNCKAALKIHGSPSRYLSEVLKDKCDAQDFVNWLWTSFPEKPDLLYNYEAALPSIHSETEMGESLPLRLHIATLGFDAACSVKPPCGPDLAMELVEQFLKGGFVTADNPLLCSQPEGIFVCQHDLTRPWSETLATGKTLKPFNLAYAKGFARCSTLLMLLHKIMLAKVDLRTFPELTDTTGQIYAHVVQSSSRIDEALFNMKISARHSLRKANNLVQCVFILKKLMVVGGLQEIGTFIKRWNAMTTRSFMISGRKMMSLKQLFEVTTKDSQFQNLLNGLIFFITNNWSMIRIKIFSEIRLSTAFDQTVSNLEETLDLILAHVQECGWEKSVWSDENLSTKKLYPGFQFNAKGQQWTQRLRRIEQNTLY